MDICRRRRRGRAFTSAHHLPDAALWLANILLGVRRSRADRRSCLVSHRARFSRRAPKCFPRRAGIHPLRSDGKNFDRRSSKARPWKNVLTSKEVLAVTLSYFCFGYVAWIFFSWFYIYLAQVRGLNLKASAF